MEVWGIEVGSGIWYVLMLLAGLAAGMAIAAIRRRMRR